MKTKWVKVILVLATASILFAGCKKNETVEEPVAEVTEEATPTPTETPIAAQEVTAEPTPTTAADPENMNLLTGEGTLAPFAVGKKPVAVMVNNVTPSLPQSGISKADVVFEIPVEGDLTRLMALYGDMTNIPVVCSIRSCRYYFPILAVGFDAFYVHYGIDQTIARETINSLDIDSLEGANNDYTLFGRDQNRINQGISREHTAYFDGPNFSDHIDASLIELEDNKKGPAFNFVDYGTVVRPEGNDCNSVKINFGASSTTMTYDAASNKYLMFHNDSPQVDADDNTQVSFTNVLILETDISVRDDVGRKNVNWQGGADSVGYYISDGAVQQIHWSKPDTYDYLTFTDMNGNELKINRGKTYIAMNYAGRETFA